MPPKQEVASHPRQGPNQPGCSNQSLPAACRCLTASPAFLGPKTRSHITFICSYLQPLDVLAHGQLLAGALGDLALVSLLEAAPSPFTGGLGLRPHHGVTQVQSAASTLTHCRRPAPGDCLRSSPRASPSTARSGHHPDWVPGPGCQASQGPPLFRSLSCPVHPSGKQPSSRPTALT